MYKQTGKYVRVHDVGDGDSTTTHHASPGPSIPDLLFCFPQGIKLFGQANTITQQPEICSPQNSEEGESTSLELLAKVTDRGHLSLKLQAMRGHFLHQTHTQTKDKPKQCVAAMVSSNHTSGLRKYLYAHNNDF